MVDSYPIGHHTRITTDFDDVRQYFGLVLCTVVAPRKLNLPVLPARYNKKLTFALCRTCAENQHQGTCDHSDDQRKITGTWCTPELHEALDRGYHIVEVFEVWHFASQQDRLFAEYIDCFLKIKTEASGWPVNCQTDEEKDHFIRDFKDRENIQLNKEKVAVNPGLRALAKLCLNR